MAGFLRLSCGLCCVFGNFDLQRILCLSGRWVGEVSSHPFVPTWRSRLMLGLRLEVNRRGASRCCKKLRNACAVRPVVLFSRVRVEVAS